MASPLNAKLKHERCTLRRRTRLAAVGYQGFPMLEKAPVMIETAVIGKFLFGKLVGNLWTKVAEKWFTPTLGDKLLAATTEWTASLPAELECNPRAVLPEEGATDAASEGGSAATRVREVLDRREI